MKKQADAYYIIDFDSTLIQGEGLDELAVIALHNKPGANSIIAKIRNITNLGMQGRLPIDRSLALRLELLQASRAHVQTLARALTKKITPSFFRNRTFLRKHASHIYVITSGFQEYVLPVIKQLGLRADHVLANRFLFDRSGRILGLDRANPLAQAGGKVQALRRLSLSGPLYIIGDGYTDFEMKQVSAQYQFCAFCENVSRPAVVKKADMVVKSFDEFLYLRKLPMRHSYPRSRLKVLLLENVHPLARELFEHDGFHVDEEHNALNEKQLAARIKDISILGVRSRTRLSPLVLNQAPRLLAVGAYCIGTEQTDAPACSAHGVPVFNAPYSNTRSVVEIVLAEIVLLLRRAFESSTALHRGTWLKTATGCYEVRGKKLGIVGYGNIGSQLSVLAESLGMEVYYYDIVEKLTLGKAQKCRSLQELLEQVDVVSMHVDGRATNENMISSAQFKRMRKGSIFLNFSRGKVVDIRALARALTSGHIAGAGVDVFPYEPKGKNERFLSELRGLPNVILTPHIGGSTLEAQRNIAEFVSARLLEYVNNGSSFSSVNFPQIQLPCFNVHTACSMCMKMFPGSWRKSTVS